MHHVCVWFDSSVAESVTREFQNLRRDVLRMYYRSYQCCRASQTRLFTVDV